MDRLTFFVVATTAMFVLKDLAASTEVAAQPDSDDIPVKSLRNKFAAPVLKFLVCTS